MNIPTPAPWPENRPLKINGHLVLVETGPHAGEKIYCLSETDYHHAIKCVNGVNAPKSEIHTTTP